MRQQWSFQRDGWAEKTQWRKMVILKSLASNAIMQSIFMNCTFYNISLEVWENCFSSDSLQMYAVVKRHSKTPWALQVWNISGLHQNMIMDLSLYEIYIKRLLISVWLRKSTKLEVEKFTCLLEVGCELWRFLVGPLDNISPLAERSQGKTGTVFQRPFTVFSSETGVREMKQ